MGQLWTGSHLRVGRFSSSWQPEGKRWATSRYVMAVFAVAFLLLDMLRV